MDRRATEADDLMVIDRAAGGGLLAEPP